jgi:hypothetical protein
MAGTGRVRRRLHPRYPLYALPSFVPPADDTYLLCTCGIGYSVRFCRRKQYFQPVCPIQRYSTCKSISCSCTINELMAAQRKISTNRSLCIHSSFYQPTLQSTMKSFTFAIITALSLLQGSFAAPAVKARDCASIPSTADPAIRDQVYRITQSRGVTAKVLLSTFEVSQLPLFVSSMRIANVDCFRPPGSSPMSTTCEQEPIPIVIPHRG